MKKYLAAILLFALALTSRAWLMQSSQVWQTRSRPMPYFSQDRTLSGYYWTTFQDYNGRIVLRGWLLFQGPTVQFIDADFPRTDYGTYWFNNSVEGRMEFDRGTIRDPLYIDFTVLSSNKLTLHALVGIQEVATGTAEKVSK
jgi:hypothetical protein